MENENKTNEETKQVSNEQNGTSNINYNVKMPKQKSNTPVLICLIIVIVSLLGIIACLIIMNIQNKELNNETSDNQNNTEQSANKEANNTDTQDQNNIFQNLETNTETKTTEQKIAEIYNNTKGWYSKSNMQEMIDHDSFKIENGKIIFESSTTFEYKNGETIIHEPPIKTRKEIEFSKGTPKYIDSDILVGGGPLVIIMITEEGKAYIAENSWSGTLYELNNDSLSEDEFKFKEINLNSKIIDMAMKLSTENMTYISSPYFLTEDGNIYNSDGKTLQEINKNHIRAFGDYYASIYVNSDNTVEITDNNEKNDEELAKYSRNYVNIYGKNGYIELRDTQNNRVVVSAIFDSDSNGYPYTYYVVDSNNKLLEFSEKTDFIAKIVENYKDKKVKDISTYREYTNIADGLDGLKVIVEFEDGDKATFDRASLKYKK